MLVSFPDQRMKRLPQRLSLVTETANILREQIDAGAWTKFLPGERDLAARLRVSRPTLRAALELLQREGRFEIVEGRRHLLRLNEKPSFVSSTSRVVLLTPIPLHRMPPFVMFWVDELREHLGDEGFDLEVHVSSAAQKSRPEQTLERLVQELRAAAWVLFLSSEPMQRWFSARGLPCVITGSCFPNLNLPSVDIDARATCRHAAGIFLAKRHRSIALLLPEGNIAGDQASETGFLEGAAQNKEVRANVVRHNGSVEGVCRKLDGLVSDAHPVTGLLVARSVHALTAITYLQRRGLKLPQDVAVISRDNDPFLDFIVPGIARYACASAAFARRVSRLVVPLAKQGTTSTRQILLMPEWIKGETV
jgi:DNA-binding LacI/PurR family transcriptional regulator